jgi:hypothetical protein
VLAQELGNMMIRIRELEHENEKEEGFADDRRTRAA